MRLRLLAAFLLSTLGACASAPARAPAPAPAPAAAPDAGPTAAAAPEPPALRLPRTVLPTGYKATLAVDPGKDGFSGRVEIAARVAEPTRLFWLHAKNLTLEKASATAGGKTVPLEILAHDNVSGFRAAEELPAGDLTIAISYQGKIDDKETDGIFRQKEKDDWYAFTQFESIYARRAFPCFDEPDNKVPWQIALEVPGDLMAVSNTPMASDTPTGHGTRLVTFAPTRPLPSYLVAFAVGPFAVVDAGKLKSGAPFRVIVPRGRGGDTGYVVASTPPLVALLEEYFGIPYPFEKLDFLAVPIPADFSAMENPGLITFNQGLLLARAEDLTMSFQRGFAYVAAHELAHQWFGDLVTLAWWDDIWLNESFADWMAHKVVSRWKPEWHLEVGAVGQRSFAMMQDSLQTTRKIRQPVTSEDDVAHFVDPGITYFKGAAIIAMFESWVGEEKFRQGVRAFLEAHEWGNAVATDLFDAVGKSAGVDLAAPLSSFLDQVGVPLVSFELVCKAGQPPHLLLAQERYVPKGSRADADQTWKLPVCVELPGKGKAIERRCTLLTAKSTDWMLGDVTGCPAWVQPNAGGVGYYRSALKGDLLARLLKAMDRLPAPVRLRVINDVEAQTASGKVDVGVALAFVPRYAGNENTHLVAAAAGIAARIREMIPDELMPSYSRFVQKMFGARARKLGWKPAAGEDDETRILRKSIVPLVCDDGEDKALAAQAKELALAWLEDHRAIDPDMVGAVLGSAAYHGDETLYERFKAAAKKTSDRRDRQRLLGALAGFRQPALVEKNIALVTSGEFDARESIPMFFGGLQNPATRRLVYESVKTHYDTLIEKLPKPLTPYLVFAGVAQCDAKVAPEVEAFFKERTAKEPGGAQVYQQAMEAMGLCIKQREAQRPAMAAFLEKY